ncbi:MAG TPA: hypothetical protein VFL79_01080 [Terriglobia bacterium]|nr:hypothetical protein [Terriglobia bacterium]
MLKTLRLEIWTTHTCAEAARLVDQTRPELIFTATDLIDGTWCKNVELAGNAPVQTNAIVVGRNNDMGLYLSAMDRGAFDFIIPPFEWNTLNHVVRVAGGNARRQRKIQEKRAAA